MRILYFSRGYTPHDHRFLKALGKTGHELSYLMYEKLENGHEDRPVPPHVEIVPWAGGKAPVRLRDGARLWLDLKRVIRDIQPDLIHAGPIQRPAFLTAAAGFHPLVSMSWGYDLLLDARRNRWWEWATRFTLERSDVFVGDCRTIRDLAVQYGMNPERIVTFPWGVDLEHFQPSPPESHPLRERLGWGTDCVVVLSTRGWAPIYGTEELVEGFIHAAREVPELRLLMLGNGPLAPMVHRRFIDSGLIDRVHFPGVVSRQDLPGYFHAADLYLSASHSDGTSISLLEALATATPVLVSDIPGNREWISPGEAGWLFPVGDEKGMGEGLLAAVKKQAHFSSMGRQARTLAEERADWEKNFPVLLEAYQMAVE